jgi:hypothetical protein
VKDVKLRAFIPPGEVLDIEARLAGGSGDTATLMVETRRGRRVVGSARVIVASEKSA